MPIETYSRTLGGHLAYKSQIGGKRGVGSSGQFRSPGWVPEADHERLARYTVYGLYLDGQARETLPQTEQAQSLREYGEPELLVSRVVSAVLGDEQEIVCPDAAGHEEDPPEDATPEDLAKNERKGRAEERQQWLRDWADAEGFATVVQDVETDAVGLGDGVFTLAWSAKRNRVVVDQVYDPGLYFPVLTNRQDYPERVHFAWEEDAPTPDGRTKRQLHRVTYELGPIRPTSVVEPREGGRLRRLFSIPGPGEQVTLRAGDLYTQDGRITRRYPYQPPGDEPSDQTCYLTHAVWWLDEVDTAQGLYDLSEQTARYMVNEDGEVLDQLDLGFDFLPIIHEPNTPSRKEHFGRSVLARPIQLLDELAFADTDASRAQGTTGAGLFAFRGANLPRNEVTGEADVVLRPGAVFDLPTDGGVDMVNTSVQLGQLDERVGRLQDRLSIVAQVPAAFLGRVQPNEVPSGFALALGFTPLDSLVDSLRLVRNVKYPLALKMVQRISMVAGLLPPGEVYPAEYQLGSYLPTDVDAEINRLAKLYQDGLISLETALARLQAIGAIDVEDIGEEARRIREADYESAATLFQATGDRNLVYELLGKEPPPPPPPPVIRLPDGSQPAANGQQRGDGAADGSRLGVGPRAPDLATLVQQQMANAVSRETK